MLIDYLGWPLSFVILGIFGACFTINILFAFFPDSYQRVEEKLSFGVFSAVTVNPLDVNLNTIDYWAKQHNKAVGAVLGLFSFFNLVTFIRILI